MFKSTAFVFALLLSSNVFAIPLLGGGGSGNGNGKAVSSAPGTSDNTGILSALLNGKLLSVLDILPLNAGLDGVVGDLVTLIRSLLEEVIQILQKLLPSLSTAQLDELTALLDNENMTKSQILQTIDKWIAGQPIDLQDLYKNIVKDVQGKVDATLKTLTKIANGISPEVGNLVKEIANIVQNDALTLLEEDSALGALVSNLLENVQDLLEQLLKDVDRLLKELLGGILNLDDLLDLEGLLQLDGVLGGLLGKGNGGLLGTVQKLLDSLLGGSSNGGLLSIVLGKDGILGGLLGGEGGLLGGVVGKDGILGGLLGGGKKGGILSGLL